MAADRDQELSQDLLAAFRWRTDRAETGGIADLTGWWRNGALLRRLAAGLATLHPAEPTVILGPESRGVLLGAVTAHHLGVGFIELRKDRAPASDSDRWVQRTAPPDYRNRQITFGFRRTLLAAGDRVLLVDDWTETGATATTARQLVDDVGATWLGTAVVVDALTEPRLRRDLNVRSLLHTRQLPPVPDRG